MKTIITTIADVWEGVLSQQFVYRSVQHDIQPSRRNQICYERILYGVFPCLSTIVNDYHPEFSPNKHHKRLNRTIIWFQQSYFHLFSFLRLTFLDKKVSNSENNSPMNQSGHNDIQPVYQLKHLLAHIQNNIYSIILFSKFLITRLIIYWRQRCLSI